MPPCSSALTCSITTWGGTPPQRLHSVTGLPVGCWLHLGGWLVVGCRWGAGCLQCVGCLWGVGWWWRQGVGSLAGCCLHAGCSRDEVARGGLSSTTAGGCEATHEHCKLASATCTAGKALVVDWHAVQNYTWLVAPVGQLATPVMQPVACGRLPPCDACGHQPLACLGKQEAIAHHFRQLAPFPTLSPHASPAKLHWLP
jgi:hypothetical protein